MLSDFKVNLGLPTRKQRKRKRRETSLSFCECGRRLTCWLCLGKRALGASPKRSISDGDLCYACGGEGQIACKGCKAQVLA